MYLTNAWYVAAWASEVGRTLLERTIIEKSIVLYRKENGDPVAISNVCPHRLVPLSLGKILGDVVQCKYHGLEFDCTGKCVKNPHGDQKIPSRMAVRSYPVVEKHSLIWLWMGDPADADPATIPDFSCLTDPSLGIVTGMIEMKANFELVTDNLMDLTHSAYLHEGILSNEAIPRGKHEIVQNGTTVYSNRWCPDALAPPAWGAAFDNYDKPVDHWLYMRWDAPAHLLLDAGISPVGRPREEGVWAYGTDILTPKDKFTTYYFWGVSRSNKQGDPAADALWRESISAAFEGQDQVMIEAQQRWLGEHTLDEMEPVLLPTDAGAIRARRVLAKLIAEQAGGAMPEPKNPSLTELQKESTGTANPVKPVV